jgi:hypothetical protein
MACTSVAIARRTRAGGAILFVVLGWSGCGGKAASSSPQGSDAGSPPAMDHPITGDASGSSSGVSDGAGCCASGQCYPGDSDTHCGVGNGPCTDCLASGRICMEGVCVANPFMGMSGSSSGEAGSGSGSGGSGSSGGTASDGSACGAAGLPCCGTTCNGGNVCVALGGKSQCEPCGALSQPCCTTVPRCADSTAGCAYSGVLEYCLPISVNPCSGSCADPAQTCVSNGMTSFCVACGGLGNACCGSTCSSGLQCTGGKCQ